MSTLPTPSADHRPGPSGVRASDAEREHHAQLLREHGAQGRLSVEELAERLERVYGARTRGELAELVRDLPPSPAPAPRPPDRRRRELREHVAVYAAVNLLLIVIWAVTGAGYFWPIWPLLGWGIGVASQAWEARWGRPGLCGAGQARRGAVTRA